MLFSVNRFYKKYVSKYWGKNLRRLVIFLYGFGLSTNTKILNVGIFLENDNLFQYNLGRRFNFTFGNFFRNNSKILWNFNDNNLSGNFKLFVSIYWFIRERPMRILLWRRLWSLFFYRRALLCDNFVSKKIVRFLYFNVKLQFEKSVIFGFKSIYAKNLFYIKGYSNYYTKGFLRLNKGYFY